MREPFTVLTTMVTPLEMENVDTDQIIPARFLKATTREGFGEFLFRDWRLDERGRPRAGSPFTYPPRGKALAAGKNFGCGSSREHAVWAILGAGFRVVVSSDFADIFRNNALNNGLLPVQVTVAFLARLFATLRERPGTLLTVDLERQSVCFDDARETFDISPYKKMCLVNGLDDVDYLLAIRDRIELHEKKQHL